MKKIALAVAAALGVAALATPAVAQDSELGSAGANPTVGQAIGSLSGPTLGGLTAGLVGLLSVAAQTSAAPVDQDEDDDEEEEEEDPTTTVTTTTPDGTVTVTVTSTVTTTITTTN
ncbi:MAG: hypothetical protein JJU10_07610 [Idiomarina sp.]|nr:hypothetical protein [Idiomarina sp.]